MSLAPLNAKGTPDQPKSATIHFMINTTVCPCGSGQSYTHCCELFHTHEKQPAHCTPETLMRSRYSAYSLANIDYLIATHHPDFRNENDRADLTSTLATTQWQSLQIIKASRPVHNKGQVEFVAFWLASDNTPRQLHEQSEFCFDHNRWWYTTGEILNDITLGRNSLCWCGSGLKYKKCHAK